MSKIRGMTTCNVCGRDFALIVEEHHVVAEPKQVGALAKLVSSDKAKFFDAFDCPHCGCQNILQIRNPEACPCDYGICDECEHLGYTEEDDDDE